MPTFERGDVIRVPLPYTDREIRQYRPALVVSHGPLGDDDSLLWVVMITSAADRGWKEDVSVDHEAAGLPAPSVIRTAKIATIEARDADRIGSVPSETWTDVASALRKHLGW